LPPISRRPAKKNNPTKTVRLLEIYRKQNRIGAWFERRSARMEGERGAAAAPENLRILPRVRRRSKGGRGEEKGQGTRRLWFYTATRRETRWRDGQAKTLASRMGSGGVIRAVRSRSGNPGPYLGRNAGGLSSYVWAAIWAALVGWRFRVDIGFVWINLYNLLYLNKSPHYHISLYMQACHITSISFMSTSFRL
jgi:hypothetical protein